MCVCVCVLSLLYSSFLWLPCCSIVVVELILSPLLAGSIEGISTLPPDCLVVTIKSP